MSRSPQLDHAREDLAAYAAAMYPRFELPAHLRILVGVLERVERGELDRVIICMPPRHGKSMTTSQLFPAWYLGAIRLNRSSPAHTVRNLPATSAGVQEILRANDCTVKSFQTA